jgi:hypothetical protein
MSRTAEDRMSRVMEVAGVTIVVIIVCVGAGVILAIRHLF